MNYIIKTVRQLDWDQVLDFSCRGREWEKDSLLSDRFFGKECDETMFEKKKEIISRQGKVNRLGNKDRNAVFQ